MGFPLMIVRVDGAEGSDFFVVREVPSPTSSLPSREAEPVGRVEGSLSRWLQERKAARK